MTTFVYNSATSQLWVAEVNQLSLQIPQYTHEITQARTALAPLQSSLQRKQVELSNVQSIINLEEVNRAHHYHYHGYNHIHGHYHHHYPNLLDTVVDINRINYLVVTQIG